MKTDCNEARPFIYFFFSAAADLKWQYNVITRVYMATEKEIMNLAINLWWIKIHGVREST